MITVFSVRKDVSLVSVRRNLYLVSVRRDVYLISVSSGKERKIQRVMEKKRRYIKAIDHSGRGEDSGREIPQVIDNPGLLPWGKVQYRTGLSSGRC